MLINTLMELVKDNAMYEGEGDKNKITYNEKDKTLTIKLTDNEQKEVKEYYNKSYFYNERIDKEYLDNWIKHYVFSWDFRNIYNKHNQDLVTHFKDRINFCGDSKDAKIQKMIIQFKALIEYLENNEELPDEYKCLKAD
ncbi:hypothetical protein [Clostridium sp.]|uniref:hypothetical protein n=1 Tax=Clostridium sp. TaxID=1506 RepID=UPI00261565E5|nr:hypothetical protein [Clostridium sp.]